jgi:type IV pilus assembly protein PilE
MGLSDKRGQCGITLIELMVALAIVSVLVAVAMPSYRAYVVRSRLPAALDALTSYATRQEQAYQDGGNYGVANCVASVPTPDNFTVACALGNNGQGFTATATGSGIVSGYAYSIDNLGIRRTVSHPRGVPAANCWSLKGASCDT